jgi:hypothetical protein
MDILDSLNADNQRRFLIYIVPGGLVLWPLAALFMLNTNIDLTDSEGPTLIFTVSYLLLAMAIGMLLEEISARCEKHVLDKNAVKKMNKGKSAEKGDVLLTEEKFEQVWTKYLKIRDSDKSTVISRYYSSISTRFKFECNIFFAIPLMLLGHLGYALEEGGEWHLWHTLAYLLISTMLEIYLWSEMRESSVLLHKRRLLLIEVLDPDQQSELR